MNDLIKRLDEEFIQNFIDNFYDENIKLSVWDMKELKPFIHFRDKALLEAVKGEIRKKRDFGNPYRNLVVDEALAVLNNFIKEVSE